MHGFFREAMTLYSRVMKAEILTRAAALAYSTVLGIVPIVGLVFWYLSSIRVTERWLELTKQFILSHLNFSSTEDFLSIFNQLTTNIQSAGWGWIGMGLLAYTAWSLITQFGNAVDVILETAENPAEAHLSFMGLATRRLLIMLWLPLSITLSLAGTEWIRRDSWIRYLLHLPYIGAYFAAILAWTVGIATYFFVYKYIPRRPVRWQEALKAAMVVGPASEAIRFAFAWYTRVAVSTQKIYGVFAVVPLFILWVQLSWLVLLVGALFIRFPALPDEETRD